MRRARCALFFDDGSIGLIARVVVSFAREGTGFTCELFLRKVILTISKPTIGRDRSIRSDDEMFWIDGEPLSANPTSR